MGMLGWPLMSTKGAGSSAIRKNVNCKEDRATEADRERLWQAYVARNKMRCGRAEGFCYETDVFVAPSF